MRKFLVVTQLFYFFAFIESLTIDEDYDANSRNPYSYKYSIDDPESDTNFEASESGDPEVVRGSYRIALPDGRIQTVTYEVIKIEKTMLMKKTFCWIGSPFIRLQSKCILFWNCPIPRPSIL